MIHIEMSAEQNKSMSCPSKEVDENFDICADKFFNIIQCFHFDNILDKCFRPLKRLGAKSV